MTSNTCSLPTDKEIEQAENSGFRDGLMGSNKAANYYMGKDILDATYIMAKIRGSDKRAKTKNNGKSGVSS